MAQVVERRTYGLHNGELLHKDHMEDDKAGLKPFWKHRAFNAPKDTVTVLLFDRTGAQKCG